MQERNDRRSDSLKHEKVRAFNRNIAGFAFFLILSFILWYLNFLGKETESTIVCPVRYVNPPDGFVVRNEDEVKLNLNLKGTGFSIIKLKISGTEAPVGIDISAMAYHRIQSGGELKNYILTYVLKGTIVSQLRSGCEIVSVTPDSLFFTLDRSMAKPSPMKPDNKVLRGR